MEEFKSKMVSDVMWYSDVVAGNWYEADGRLFRVALAPLYPIPISGGPVAERRAAGCVGDNWCSGASCPGQRAGVVSLGSRNYSKASRMMTMLAPRERPE